MFGDETGVLVDRDAQQQAARRKLLKLAAVVLGVGSMVLDVTVLHGQELFSENIPVGNWVAIPVQANRRHRLRVRPPRKAEPLEVKVRGPSGEIVVASQVENPGTWDSTTFSSGAAGTYEVLIGPELEESGDDEEDGERAERRRPAAYVVLYGGDWSVVFRILDALF